MSDNAAGDVIDLHDAADDESLEHDLFLQVTSRGDPEAEPIKQVVVPVQAGAAKAPEPTIETLMPKHIKKMTAQFRAANNGKKPDKMEKLEIKRTAVQSAADEINEAQQNKDALEIAKMKEQRLVRRVKRDKETIDKISQNEEYAARKAYLAADRKVKYLEHKHNKLQEKAEEALAELHKEKEDTKLAYIRRNKAKKESLEARQRLIVEQKRVD